MMKFSTWIFFYLFFIAASSTKLGDKGPMKYPVMVFVHGESYEWNSGNPYEGAVLASFGQILVVTINYRLGILGFLNANTNRYVKSPANYGLMDIIAALHWIQENISSFGGDPSSVTLAGHGTGAACVHFLISSSAVPEGKCHNLKAFCSLASEILYSDFLSGNFMDGKFRTRSFYILNQAFS